MNDVSQPTQVDQDGQRLATGTRNRVKQLGKEILKRTLPKRLLSEIRAYRKNPPDQRSTYIRLRISTGANFKRMAKLRVPPTARSLLFVCFGNIIRSPMCEALARQALLKRQRSDVTVTSAGLHAIAGRPAHAWAITAAAQMGVDLSHHGARALNAEMVEQADAILAMDCRNVVELVSQFPRARNKIYVLGAYAENNDKSVEIEDPYYGHEEMTRECYKRLKSCIERLTSSLRSPKAG